jgi:hypothetical protein
MPSRRECVDLPRFLLLACASVILVWTLAPMDFDPRGLHARFLEAAAWDLDEGRIKALAHFLAFFCLGVLFGRITSRPGIALATLACFCLGLEAGQLLLPDRHSRLSDLVLNIAGGALGFGIFRQTKFSWRRERRGVLLKIFFFSSLVLWLVVSLVPLTLLTLKSWRHDCRLLVGNEADHSEPWAGSLSRLVLAPGLHPTALSATGSGLQYTFDEPSGDLVRSQGGLRSSDLDLVVPGRTPLRGELLLTNAVLSSAGSAARLSELIASSGSFTIFADVPRVLPSTNAGRLLSLSSSPSARNFMLGREGNDLVFRVRNGVMEENGPRHILRARDVLDGRDMRLRAIYTHGVAALFNNGVLLKRSDFRQPTSYLGLGSGCGAAVSAGILLGILVAFPAHALLPVSTPFSHPCALVGTALLSSLPYFLVCMVLGGPFGLSFAGISTVAIGLAYLVAHSFCSNKVNALLQSGPRGGSFPDAGRQY